MLSSTACVRRIGPRNERAWGLLPLEVQLTGVRRIAAALQASRPASVGEVLSGCWLLWQRAGGDGSLPFQVAILCSSCLPVQPFSPTSCYPPRCSFSGGNSCLLTRSKPESFCDAPCFSWIAPTLPAPEITLRPAAFTANSSAFSR